MKVIENQSFDQERALYGSDGLHVRKCRFDGPADGESAFKECRDIRVSDSYFNLRYPFWHDTRLQIENCEMTPNCRAALWYSQNVTVTDSKLCGIKALRECADVVLHRCDVVSAEFGWFTRGMEMADCTVQGEYFMMRSDHLKLKNVRLNGKYSFQYISDSLFENCDLDTKDAFWHARNVTVRNCTVKGEYLGWYCENVTFENCRIIGTQPLCYCRGLKLVNCEMIGTDLSFERSEVEATVISHVDSIKNVRSGFVCVSGTDEQIWDDPLAQGVVICGGTDEAIAETLLSSGAYTCVLCQNGVIHTTDLRGVKPLVQWLEGGTVSPGFCAADKVVGKATAYLYCLLGAKAVYAGVMSSAALAVLEAHGITAGYGKLTEHIINRRGDGICPFEAAVLDISDPQAALTAIRKKMEELKL